MASGKLNRKPSDVFRDRINARTRKALIEAGKKIGHLTDSQKMTPSERKSNSMRKKLSRGVVEPKAPLMKDCRGCTRPHDTCNGDITSEGCKEHSVPTRCAICGGKTIVRVVVSNSPDRYICHGCREAQES